ncbi:hypothetical protein Tco_0542117 [Tanacetum coccineum]
MLYSNASQTSSLTPTSVIFGDDETIATLLINMSKAKAVSKEKEKGVELKDVEDTDRPRTTSTRSTLTLKSHSKLIPKDKGKSKKNGKPEEEKNKIAEEEAANEALIKNFDDVKARIEADIILAEKLQYQKVEHLTIGKKEPKFLHDTILLLKESSLLQKDPQDKRNRTSNQ